MAASVSLLTMWYPPSFPASLSAAGSGALPGPSSPPGGVPHLPTSTAVSVCGALCTLVGRGPGEVHVVSSLTAELNSMTLHVEWLQ